MEMPPLWLSLSLWDWPEQPKLQLPLFFLFLLSCMIIVVDNLCLMNLICLNSHLHKPMYFFVFNLSSIIFVTHCLYPQNANELYFWEYAISFTECMSQVFFFCFLSALSAMCWQPWPMIAMWPSVSPCCTQWRVPSRCVLLLTSGFVCDGISWSHGPHTGCMMRLNFCDSNIINHFMCDIVRSSSSSVAAFMPIRL